MIAFGVLTVAGTAACKPDLDERTFAVTGPRVLAVKSEPAEAVPGAPVTLSALYVDASGTLPRPFSWDFCEIRKPLAELGPASPRCTAPSTAASAPGEFLPLGTTPTVAGALPADGCRQFGPEAPAGTATEPAGRPVDPDPTGGFYQPVRLLAGQQQATLGRVRITCGVAGATADQLSELGRDAHPNTNPALVALSERTRGALAPTGSPAPGAPAPAAHPGERLSLEASWATCDDPIVACTGAESYAAFDITTHTVAHRREAMRLSWFASGGVFDEDHTGRDASDPATTSSNAWVAPAAPGLVHLWVVARDDRGGVGWSAYDVSIQ